jgi:hypothetical protein
MGFNFLESCVSAEIYDPVTGKFTVVEGMNYAGKTHVATLLNNGCVLIIYTKEAEIFNPKTNKFSLTGKLNIPIPRDPYLSLMPDGKVLVIHTNLNTSENTIKIDIEIYDPKTGKFSILQSAEFSDFEINPRMTIMNNNKILFTGGVDNPGPFMKRLKKTVIYDINTNNFTVGPDMNQKRSGHNAILLKDGNVLITGGDYSSFHYLKNAEIYKL